MPVAADVEVHEEERQIVEHVDRRQRLAELERIEGHRRAVDQNDVAEVEVAVAAADAAGAAALDEHGRKACEGRPQPAGERNGCSFVALSGAEGRDQLPDDGLERLSPVEGSRDRALAVIAGNHVGQRFRQLVGQRPLLGPVDQHRRLGEAAHMDGPVDDAALSIERQATAGAPHDRNDTEVDLWRMGSVELELARGGTAAVLERGEVDERQIDPLLDLVDFLAHQKHARDVRLDHVHVWDAALVCDGIAEESGDLALFGFGWRIDGRGHGVRQLSGAYGRTALTSQADRDQGSSDQIGINLQ